MSLYYTKIGRVYIWLIINNILGCDVPSLGFSVHY